MPELGNSKYFLHENVVFGSSLGPLIVLVQDLSSAPDVLEWSNLVIKYEILTRKREVDMAYIPRFQLRYGEL